MSRCLWCGKEISKEKRAGTEYCSMKCYHKKYQEQHPAPPKEVFIKNCRQCGEEFKTTNHLKLSCSRNCHVKYQNNSRITTQYEDRECPNCGKIFKPLQKRGTGKTYCSDKCRIEFTKSRSTARRLTQEEYETLLLNQKGVCAICGHKENIIHPRTKERRPLAVDHCHKTGKIRGLLCTRCNWSLGGFKDNPVILLSAIKYLQTHSGDANVEKT